jgi:hypothetical protein
VRLVVARYEEPLDWLDDVPPEWEVVVYNKGSEVNGRKAVDLPNVGREAHTFAHHNASAPPPADWTAFVQGNPFDHWPDPIDHIHRIVERGDRVGWLGFHYDTAWNDPPHTLDDLGFRAVWESLDLDGFCPTRLSFPAGAQMVVHGDVIAGHSMDWWKRAALTAATGDWRVAHCFERLWPVIYR